MKISLLVFRMRASSFLSSFSSPWPDPNSSVLSKIDFGVPLVELFKWLDVRDIFLGQNLKEQDIPVALALARDCNHPDAVWLTSIFERKDVSTRHEARNVFLAFEHDAHALCFAWWLCDDRVNDESLLRRAADMGNAFACSSLCHQVWDENKEEALRLARCASGQNERDGFYYLGYLAFTNIGCEEDLKFGKENYLIAAELGNVFAASFYSSMLEKLDPARCIWTIRAALQGLPHAFLDSFPKQVEEFFSGSGNASVVFFIGQALKGNLDVEKKEIFGWAREDLLCPANQAVWFFSSQIKSARIAVDVWTCVAIRFGIVKDIRKLIGKLIWDERAAANYKI